MFPSPKPKGEGPSIEEIDAVRALAEKLPPPHSFEIDRLVGLILKENLSSERRIHEKPHLFYLWNNELGGYTLPCDLRVIDDALYFFPPLVGKWGFVRKRPLNNDHSPFIESIRYSDFEKDFKKALGIKEIGALEEEQPKVAIGKERNVYHHLVITPQGKIKLVVYGTPTARQIHLLSQLEKRWQDYGLDFEVVVIEKEERKELSPKRLFEVRPSIEKISVNIRYSLVPPYIVTAKRNEEGSITLEREYPKEKVDIIYGIGIISTPSNEEINITLYFTPHARRHEEVVNHFIANKLSTEGKGVLTENRKSLVIPEDEALYWKELQLPAPFQVKISDVRLKLGIRTSLDFYPSPPQLNLEGVLKDIPEYVDSRNLISLTKGLLEEVSTYIKEGWGFPQESKEILKKAKVIINVYPV